MARIKSDPDYVIDDRIYSDDTLSRIRNMTDAELEEYLKGIEGI